MPYYLKWPGDAGSGSGNPSFVQVSGTVGDCNIAIEFAEDYPERTASRRTYIFDGRRALDSTSSNGSGYFYRELSGSFVNTSNVDGYAKNGVSSVKEDITTCLAADVWSFNASSAAIGDGVFSIGGRYTEIEHWYNAAIKSITVIDSNGTHVIDISSSNGTLSQFTSLDGVLTAKLVNFPPDNSHLVFYSDSDPEPLSDYEITPESGAFAITGFAVSLTKDSIISPTQGEYTLTGESVITLVDRVISPEAGSYSITGSAVNLEYTQIAVGYEITPEPAEFIISGSSVDLIADRMLLPEQADFAISGGEPLVLKESVISPEACVFQFSGESTSLIKDSVIYPESGLFEITGYQVAFEYSGFVRRPVFDINLSYAQNNEKLSYKPNTEQLSFKS